MKKKKKKKGKEATPLTGRGEGRIEDRARKRKGRLGRFLSF